MKPLFQSLNKKMMVFLILVLGFSTAITAFFYLRIQKSDALNSAKDSVRSYSEIIHANMLRIMEVGECDDIPMIVRALAAPRSYRIVHVFDSGGKVLESNQRESQGEIFPLPHLSESGKEETILTTSPRGERIFRSVRAFYNEGKCTRCHIEKKKVLGYLGVDLSISSVENRLKSFTRMHILSGFGLLLILSGTMFLFFTRFISKPILDVSRKMAEVEDGRFDIQIPVKSRDEVGHLAGSFNFMVKKLQEMRKREEDQQKLLLSRNEDLQEKIRELTILYESGKAINQSLEIEEILSITIERVTRSLGFDRVVLTVFDEDQKTLRGKWSIGIDEEIVQQVQIPKGEINGVLYETCQKKEPVVVRDTSSYPIIETKVTRRCWEVVNCQKKECPVYGTNELRCWMIKGTRCDLEMEKDTFEEKIRICGACPYLKEIVKRNDIVNLLLFGSHSFVSVPLMVREHVLGILLADKLHSEREVTEEDVKFLVTFLSHVSVAIENAILYHKLGEKVDLSQRQLQETNEQLLKKIEELNEIRSFNESILQNLYGGVVTYDKKGLVTFMNKSGLELLGWEESEVLGKSIDEVFWAGKEMDSLFRKVLVENGDPPGEMEFLRKGGGRIPVEVFLSYLRDKDGNTTGVTGIFRDITEKKEIESRMRRMDKLASLGQLASGIAHEIKNPLAGIGSAIQVLSSSIQLDDRRKEVVKEILNQIQRLDGTIRNLLGFAKPGQPKLVSTDLNEVIEAVLFLVSQQLKKQDIQPRLEIDRNLPKIMIDPQQIQQALLNVVLNAVEAMPPGGTIAISMKEKTIALQPQKKKKSHLSVTISDTGTGISEEVMAKIFNPFYTTKTSGTGLGLSITQRIIEQHNGRILIKSETGKGTSFTIDLPV